jgi:hypothetical protein
LIVRTHPKFILPSLSASTKNGPSIKLLLNEDKKKILQKHNHLYRKSIRELDDAVKSKLRYQQKIGMHGILTEEELDIMEQRIKEYLRKSKNSENDDYDSDHPSDRSLALYSNNDEEVDFMRMTMTFLKAIK